MLKSSSLCLYSSNLGSFWLKIEQFWPFQEISIFSNGSHLGCRTVLTDTILKGGHPRIISAKFGWDWLSSFRGEDVFLFHPPFYIFSLAAILVGSRDHRTQFWKGAIQGPFHQSLVQISPVASEELIKMWKVNGRTDDRRSVVTIAHMILWVRWAKKKQKTKKNQRIYFRHYRIRMMTSDWLVDVSDDRYTTIKKIFLFPLARPTILEVGRYVGFFFFFLRQRCAR